MKKLLALVLALVMTLSLCTISNAAYSDAADVDYNEAVDVMSAVGVFQGADGKFSPKAELTREQVLASLGLDEKTFQEIMRPQAVFELQTDLLLDAIVKAENIELDDGELDETYNKMAEEYKMEVDKIKQYVDEKIIVLDMKRRKAAQLIRDTAVDKEPEAKEEAAETKEEAAE